MDFSKITDSYVEKSMKKYQQSLEKYKEVRESLKRVPRIPILFIGHLNKF